jgi:hypothetical protein
MKGIGGKANSIFYHAVLEEYVLLTAALAGENQWKFL